MIRFFNEQWDRVPVIVVDVETTGVARTDRPVQFGLARFEGGALVASKSMLVNPGRPIPAEATAIHGITDEMVAGLPAIEEAFALADVKELLANAQPLGFNGMFDRFKVPPFTDPEEWPWLDPLVMVRDVDKYARGQGRHRLEACCQRHGIELTKAHDAGHDAIAAGRLFYMLAPKWLTLWQAGEPTLGEFLEAQRKREAAQWCDFWSYKASQLPADPHLADNRGTRSGVG